MPSMDKLSTVSSSLQPSSQVEEEKVEDPQNKVASVHEQQPSDSNV